MTLVISVEKNTVLGKKILFQVRSYDMDQLPTGVRLTVVLHLGAVIGPVYP